MLLYKDYAPTTWDTKGLLLDDRQDWFVVLGQNRDSGTLERSNFACVLHALGGESDTVEVHRFDHWACGWLEIILAAPSMREPVEDISRKLDNYPAFNEDHWGMLESDEAQTYWASMSIADRVRVCQKYDVCVFAARRDNVPNDDRGDLVPYLADGC